MVFIINIEPNSNVYQWGKENTINNANLEINVQTQNPYFAKTRIIYVGIEETINLQWNPPTQLKYIVLTSELIPMFINGEIIHS